MKNIRVNIASTILGFTLLTMMHCGAALASSIDPANKFAWSENTGWLNFGDSHGGVRVFNDHLEGYVWSENIGWISLGSHDGGGSHKYVNTSASNWGVNNDGAGNLSGFAWSENTGWVEFNTTTGVPVTVDSVSGEFDGYAWSANVGWIHFQNATPAYRVNLQDADLSVIKTADIDHATPGNNLTFAITITNNGAGTAGNIQVEDSLPTGLTYSSVDAAAWGCSHTAGTVICTLDTLAPGSDSNIFLTVSSSDTLEQHLTNTAVSSMYGPDPVSNNNSDSDTVYFGLNDIGYPGDFGKTAPTNSMVNQPTSVMLDWDIAIDVTSYQVCIDTSNNNYCDSSWIDSGLTTSASPAGLVAGTTYYWQVRASNSEGMTGADTGTWWSFTTMATDEGRIFGDGFEDP